MLYRALNRIVCGALDSTVPRLGLRRALTKRASRTSHFFELEQSTLLVRVMRDTNRGHSLALSVPRRNKRHRVRQRDGARVA